MSNDKYGYCYDCGRRIHLEFGDYVTIDIYTIQCMACFNRKRRRKGRL